MTDYLTALFLGFVEGLTEFIPVSSTGHLILLIEGLKFPTPPGRVFEVFIQIGAILAVMVLYRAKIIKTVAGIPSDPVARRFALNLIIGSIPAVVIGLALHDFIKEVLYNPLIIATTLILGGIIILLFEKKFDHPVVENIDNISTKQALLIGFCQSIALIPGVSRSGATIMGSPAFRFGAVAYDIYKNWDTLAHYPHMGLMFAGLAASFVTALIVVKTVVGFVSRHGFAPFAYYRIALGLFVFFIFL